MKRLTGMILAGVTWASWVGYAQTAGSAPMAPPVQAAATKESIPTVADRTDKQKALAQQAERLCDMAAELKVQVDKTNRNILSLTVVRQAEEIEALAHKMKEQAKQ
jgi:7-keto-8-aminopelargonate synthetase-like enzyme